MASLGTAFIPLDSYAKLNADYALVKKKKEHDGESSASPIFFFRVLPTETQFRTSPTCCFDKSFWIKAKDEQYKRFSDGADYDTIENYVFAPVRQTTERAERITIDLFGDLSKATFTTNSADGIVNKLCRFYLLRMYVCQGLCCFPSTSAFGFVIASINGTASDIVNSSESTRKFYTVDEKTEVAIGGVTGSTKSGELQEMSTEAKSNATNVKEKEDVTEVGGLDSIYSQLLEIIQDPVVHAEEYRKYNVVPANGILLKGEPGVGKTLLVRSISAKTNAFLTLVNGPEILSAYLGESEQALRNVFDEAIKNAKKETDRPVLIFIDEVDSICQARDEKDTSNDGRIITQLCTLFDKIALMRKQRVVVIGATNRPNTIDSSLRRPGRFEVEITVPIPSVSAREDILKIYTKKIPDIAPYLHHIAEETIGYVGADIATLCREATLKAIRRGRSTGTKPKVTEDDFMETIKVLVPSTRRNMENDAMRGASFDQIGGYDDVKEALRDAVELCAHSQQLAAAGVKPVSGILLYGPPGCSKTTLVRCCAGSMSLSFQSLSGASVYSPYVGESEAAIREAFRKARNAKPSIIFFDEIEALVGSRQSSKSDAVRDRVLTTLLNEMEGVEKSEGVVVVAATNRIDLIDASLRNSGRFDCQIYVPLPDLHTREEILKIHAKDIPVDSSVSFADITAKTDGFSGADLAAVAKQAALSAMRENINAEVVCSKHFAQAIDIVKQRGDFHPAFDFS